MFLINLINTRINCKISDMKLFLAVFLHFFAALFGNNYVFEDLLILSFDRILLELAVRAVGEKNTTSIFNYVHHYFVMFFFF